MVKSCNFIYCVTLTKFRPDKYQTEALEKPWKSIFNFILTSFCLLFQAILFIIKSVENFTFHLNSIHVGCYGYFRTLHCHLNYEKNLSTVLLRLSLPHTKFKSMVLEDVVPCGLVNRVLWYILTYLPEHGIISRSTVILIFTNMKTKSQKHNISVPLHSK